MNSFQKLSALFAEFPGIGPRQAKRFAQFILHKNDGYINDLASLIKEVRKSMIMCTECFRFFEKNHAPENLCEICRNPNRDKDLLTVVAKDVDLEHIEKSHSYNGYYFVLGGTVPILDEQPEKRIRIRELLKIVENKVDKVDKLKEIIIAMGANPEGENTAQYVKKALEEVSAKHQIKLSELGRGLSTGSELEYSDADTLKNALKNRS
jgi:recombination protein RecR